MPNPSRPISAKKKSTMGAGWFRLFCLVFLLFGAGFLYLITLQPLWDIWRARTWPEMPCQILSSEVKRNSGRGTAYKIEIRYAYRVQDQTYESDRYHFFLAASTGYKGQRKIADRYSPGSIARCFVNPANPSEAVLNRNLSYALLWGLIPGVFMVIGLGVFLPASAFAEKPRPTANRFDADEDQGNSVELKPSASPRGKLIGMLFIAVFWNGIISIFVAIAWNAIHDGRPEWFLNIFLIPFVLIGLGFIGGVVHAFLNLFNPRLSLTVSSTTVPLGGEFKMQWSFSGNTGRIRNLRISLEGMERASYRRGTDSSTDEHVFAKLPITETSDPAAIRSGSERVAIPSHLMHSFKAPNNEIVWKLKVHGDIPRFPDVSEQYTVTVLPQSPATV